MWSDFLAVNSLCLILFTTRGEGVKSKSSGIISTDYKKLSPINMLSLVKTFVK